MPSCVVKSSKNYMSKLKKSQGITYHAGENNWNPSSASTVCSAHFDDVDFVTTAKGLRCLVLYAVPKRLLSNSPETQIQSTSLPILQMSSNVRGIANDQQATSSSRTISSSLQKYQMPVKNPYNNIDLSNTSLQQTNNGSEACDLDQPWLHVSSETTSLQQLSPKIEAAPRPTYFFHL